jgi:putative two-component system response regulator
VHDFTDPAAALAFASANTSSIGVIITDYDMPVMNGLEVLRNVRANPQLAHIPAVMLTSFGQRTLRLEALSAGANDFLTKPADAVEIRARIANLLALTRANYAQRDHATDLSHEVASAVAMVEEREREIVSLLMRAAEKRDTDTGDHIARVSTYVGLTAEALGFDHAERRRLSLASTMHDVGKIAVPDSILLKPGPLTLEERCAMELHAEQGHRILVASRADVMQLAAEIALSHHERWDGTGYPQGLKGDAIPLSGRIVAVADVFDALTTRRPYKEAWSLERARDFLIDNAGRHFDARVVNAFLSCWAEIQHARAETVLDAA